MIKLDDAKVLIVSDDDLNCSSKKKTEVELSDVGFSMKVLVSFDIVIYQGSKGLKILRLNKKE